ncbi:hypothetical protein [Blastococcus sp. SYSU D01042]
MTDRTDDPRVADGPTRDITLPPLPDRPPPALPEAWAGLRGAVDAPTTAVPGPLAPPVRPAPEAPDPAAAEVRRAAGRRTDEIVRSPGPVRERTLAFSAPEMRHRPIEPVRVGATPRRWPWVLLALVPLLVILGSAVAWLLLLRGA